MKLEKQTSLHIFILLGAFVLALAFRLVRLGVLPLGNLEAEIGLQALAAARGTKAIFGPHMTVVGLSGINFFIFTSSEFLARFWGAFLGGCIVIVPFLFRDRIGLWPATIASLILAIAPEMVGLSRIVGSPMVAMVCLLLAVGFFFRSKPILAGSALALGLMGGLGFWLGLLILSVSLVLSRWIFAGSDFPHIPTIENKRDFWLRFGLSFLAVLVIVGTCFFLAPSGLSGIFLGLFEFFSGFGAVYTSPYRLVPLSLIVFALPAAAFGLWGSLRGLLIKNKIDLLLMVWWIVGIGFVLIYPGSGPSEIIWVTFPLWILSARVIFSAWKLPGEGWLIMVMTSVIVVILSAFIALALRTLVNPTLPQDQQITTLIALFGGAVLMIAIVLLVSFGWSDEIALPGLLIGLGVVCLLGMVAVSVNSTSLGPGESFALWYPDEPRIESGWLKTSINRVLDWNKKRDSAIEIAIYDYETPAMVWVLREYDPVYFEPYLPPQSQPGLVITDQQDKPELTNTYRGQDLVWSREVLWEEMSPIQYLNWMITGEAPFQDAQIIFWARTDLLPDDQFSP